MQFPEFESWNIPPSEDTILKSGFPQRDRQLPQAPLPCLTKAVANLVLGSVSEDPSESRGSCLVGSAL